MTRFATARIGPVMLCASALTAGLSAHPTAADARERARLGDRLLHVGSRGPDVRALQRSLTRLGHRTDVDGRFGPATRRSVRRYERAEDLHRDGRVSRPQGRGIRKRVKALAGAAPAAPEPGRAVLSEDGRTAVAPPDAPPEVRAAIDAANRIVGKRYRYGGGHGHWEASGYDCSGAVSYALHGAGLLRAARASGGLMRYGKRGGGRWITVYANRRHAYAVIAGLRLDTSGRGERGPRWRPEPRSGQGYAVRHPEGL